MSLVAFQLPWGWVPIVMVATQVCACIFHAHPCTRKAGYQAPMACTQGYCAKWAQSTVSCWHLTLPMLGSAGQGWLSAEESPSIWMSPQHKIFRYLVPGKHYASKEGRYDFPF